MACENCEYWKPQYAPYINKLIMCCTKEEKTIATGNCRDFKRDSGAKTNGDHG